MGATEVLSRKTGVIVGDDVLRLFEYAREHKFAIPAIVSWKRASFSSPLEGFQLTKRLIQNVTSSSTVVASLEAARDAKSPIILQMSQGGAAYFAGKVWEKTSLNR